MSKQKKPMTLEERKLVNGSIEYSERPIVVQEQQPVEETTLTPKTFECNLKEFKAVALIKVSEEHNSWSSVVFTIKDGVIIDVTMSEPDMKVISMEQCKIDFINNVFQLEE